MHETVLSFLQAVVASTNNGRHAESTYTSMAVAKQRGCRPGVRCRASRRLGGKEGGGRIGRSLGGAFQQGHSACKLGAGIHGWYYEDRPLFPKWDDGTMIAVSFQEGKSAEWHALWHFPSIHCFAEARAEARSRLSSSSDEFEFLLKALLPPLFTIVFSVSLRLCGRY